MFGALKKKLSESVEKLSKRVGVKESEPVKSEPPQKKERPESKEAPGKKPPKKAKVQRRVSTKEKPGKPEKGRLGLRERISRGITERKISGKDIDSLFDEMEMGLLEANVSVESIDFLREKMKEELVGKEMKRGKAEEGIRNALERILSGALDQGRIDLENIPDGKGPACIVFLGYNGSGKTTSIAKLAHHLMKRGKSVVLAAGDTFRAASIEQLEVHAEKLGVKVIKQGYGSDSAAVIYDAVEHARSKGLDYVLADTAGRSHANKNLMDELKKVVKVNRPDLKILVMDSLAGNDLVEQARKFDEVAGVDAMIFTKVDVNEKGGGMLSACLAVRKPILYIGLGQEYDDIEIFDAKKFVKDLMGG